MKIIFIICRSMYYRYYSPLIKEALQRGYRVECWHDYGTARNNVKKYSFPDLACAPQFNGKLEIKTFVGFADLEVKLRQYEKEVMAVFSLHVPQVFWGVNADMRFSFKWFTLMHGPDCFAEISHLNNPPAERMYFCCYSPHWIKWGTEFLERYFPQSLRFFTSPMIKPVFAGLPEFDSFNDIERGEIRKKYGIPEGKSILIYLPFPFGGRAAGTFAWEKAFSGLLHNTPISSDGEYLHKKKLPLNLKMKQDLSYLNSIFRDTLALKQYLSGMNEAKIFRSVKKFCRRNNLFLVVKPRLKFPLIEPVKNEADLIVWDDEKQNHPPMLKELLTVTKLTVSYFSLSVLSSVFAGVPHLNIILPEVFFASKPAKYFFQEGSPSMFNFPGICQSWPINKTIRELGKCDIAEFAMNSDQRKKYVEQYMGFDDYNSSGRILDCLVSEAQK